MTDIFISYATEDRARIKPLADALMVAGWSVFWDRTIIAGENWQKVIGDELDRARCVVVAWSSASAQSDWVFQEANEGKERGVLVPVSLEEVKIPFGFRHIHSASLMDWVGDTATQGYKDLYKALVHKIGEPVRRDDPLSKTVAEKEKHPEASPLGAGQGADRKSPIEARVDLAQAPVSVSAKPRRRKPSDPKAIPPANQEKSEPRPAPKRWGMAGLAVATVALFFGGWSYQGSAKKGHGEKVGIEMVTIPAGSFPMGSETGNTDEKPVHRVTVAGFRLGKFEVTQGLWQRIMGNNPSRFENCGEDCPVEQVSFYDVQAFIAKLNRETGQTYRLPSEAEWEYAARAGTTTRYYWGEEVGTGHANCDGCGGNWEGQTAPAGSFKPNPFGLHDMSGNVWEWTQDCYHQDYANAPTDGRAWSSGDCGQRVVRGGSRNNRPALVRSAVRLGYNPVTRYDILGFRLAQD